MPVGPGSWWTEQKVNETVTPAYIHSHLRANEQEILQRSLYFGGDQSNATYLDKIIQNAKRLFLILVAIDVPDQIFGIIDDAFEDDHLPLNESAIPGLRLSIEPDTALNKRFYRTQFKYMARVLQDGEHIRYADEETVPVIGAGLKSAISLNKDGGDIVRLPGSDIFFVSKRIKLTTTVTEGRVLKDIAELKKFSHEHALSFFASYLQSDQLHVLSSPAGEYTLKAFLQDQPKAFEALPKTTRRQKLMNWPHCLANALAWLHDNGGHHGAIRPSNIHVTQSFDVFLGAMEGVGTLFTTTVADDIEAYQYAPPERWKRAVTVQNTGNGKIALPSGGRSGRKPQHDGDAASDPSTRRSESSLDRYADKDGSYTFHPASKSEFGRLRLGTGPPPNSQQKQPGGRHRRRPPDAESVDSYGITRARPAYAGEMYRAPSAMSSSSSEGRRRASSDPRRGLFVSAPESRTAVVQTWRSVQHDSFAADVFTLGAVCMDILTILCKRTFSAFARHRSKNNRNAGRGGGLADASFHANLTQVVAWAQVLSTDAEKKVKSDDSRVLSAVGPVLQVVVQCLERDPELRLKSSVLERRMKDHITRFAAIDPLHCVSTVLDPAQKAEIRRQQSNEQLLNAAAAGGRSERLPSRMQLSRTPVMEDDTSTVELPSPHSSSTGRIARYRSNARTNSTPAVSLDSFSSLNLDPDTGSVHSGSLHSATIVANSRDQSYYSPMSDRSKDSHRPIRLLHPRQPLYEDDELYDIDEMPRFPIANLDRENLARVQRDISRGAPHHSSQYYSASSSENEHDPNYPQRLASRQGGRMPPPPSQPPPRKRLPPVPAELQEPLRLDDRRPKTAGTGRELRDLYVPEDYARQKRERREREREQIARIEKLERENELLRMRPSREPVR